MTADELRPIPSHLIDDDEPPNCGEGEHNPVELDTVDGVTSYMCDVCNEEWDEYEYDRH